MSDEKKTSWGKGYEASASGGSKAQGHKPASANTPAPADSDDDVKSEIPPNEGISAADARPRARNQHVLPGILGRQLRAAYGELLNTPVPESIADLIRKLENAESAKATRGAADVPGASEDEEAQK